MRLSAALSPKIKRYVKIGRVRLFEAFGSERFSRPALFSLDQTLEKFLVAPNGVFLEVGANDGYSQSNTYCLERLKGWTGILIEPQRNLFRICRLLRRRSRCFNCACVARADHKTVQLARNRNDLTAVAMGLQSQESERDRIRADKVRTVPASTLSEIIDQAGVEFIDFMSVDVEGTEVAVISGLDLARHAPEYLLVETDDPEAIDRLVSGNMARVEQLTVHDYLWVRVQR